MKISLSLCENNPRMRVELTTEISDLAGADEIMAHFQAMLYSLFPYEADLAGDGEDNIVPFSPKS